MALKPQPFRQQSPSSVFCLASGDIKRRCSICHPNIFPFRNYLGLISPDEYPFLLRASGTFPLTQSKRLRASSCPSRVPTGLPRGFSRGRTEPQTCLSQLLHSWPRLPPAPGLQGRGRAMCQCDATRGLAQKPGAAAPPRSPVPAAGSPDGCRRVGRQLIPEGCSEESAAPTGEGVGSARSCPKVPPV